jgi:hypothetical protein
VFFVFQYTARVPLVDLAGAKRISDSKEKATTRNKVEFDFQINGSFLVEARS